jgi:hypothetical protein
MSLWKEKVEQKNTMPTCGNSENENPYFRKPGYFDAQIDTGVIRSPAKMKNLLLESCPSLLPATVEFAI